MGSSKAAVRESVPHLFAALFLAVVVPIPGGGTVPAPIGF